LSDIVERLDACSPLTIPLAHEARDEIVRLRAERDEALREKAAAMGLAQGAGALADQMRAERDRLRDALALAVATFEDMGLSPKDVVLARGRAALKGDTP